MLIENEDKILSDDKLVALLKERKATKSRAVPSPNIARRWGLVLRSNVAVQRKLANKAT